MRGFVRFRLSLKYRSLRSKRFHLVEREPHPLRSSTCAIFSAFFDSRSSFFAPKPRGNACYAGYKYRRDRDPRENQRKCVGARERKPSGTQDNTPTARSWICLPFQRVWLDVKSSRPCLKFTLTSLMRTQAWWERIKGMFPGSATLFPPQIKILDYLSARFARRFFFRPRRLFFSFSPQCRTWSQASKNSALFNPVYRTRAPSFETK